MAKRSTRIAPAAPAAGVSLAEWRAVRAAGIEHTLPSGLCVKLRRVKLQDLVMQGEIPQTLDALVKWATSKSDGWGIADLQKLSPLVDAVFKVCLLEPALAEQADDTHVTLAEFDLDDRLAVFWWANGEASALAPFLQETARRLGTAPDR